ncbi:hypothetical protein [Humidisolicoccus flavus]|uniref:hypothetical protein n=1 Tax=Humidisolicoccus flavus TaxID=3111414 RepID=UPI00324E9094
MTWPPEWSPNNDLPYDSSLVGGAYRQLEEGLAKNLALVSLIQQSKVSLALAVEMYERNEAINAFLTGTAWSIGAEALGRIVHDALLGAGGFVLFVAVPLVVGYLWWRLHLPRGVTEKIETAIGNIANRFGIGSRALMESVLDWVNSEAGAKTLTNPRMIALVAEAVSASNAFFEGFIGKPPVIFDLLGAKPQGDLADSARVFALFGGIVGGAVGVNRLFEVTGFLPRPRGSAPVTAPATNFSEKFERIPEGSTDVVIYEYEDDNGAQLFEVFVNGTQDWSAIPDLESFDLSGNLHNAMNEGGEQLHGTALAVQLAMLDAGITADDQVLLNGYSQGAAAVSGVAATGAFNVVQLVTFGNPAGQMPMPEAVTPVTVNNLEDFVPALGGSGNESGATIFTPDGVIGDPESFLDGHLTPAYRHSTKTLDASEDAVVQAKLEEFAKFGSGFTLVRSTEYEIERR